MSKKIIQKAFMATLSAVVLTTSIAAPASASLAMPAAIAVTQGDTFDVIKVGGKHRRNRNRHGGYYQDRYYGHGYQNSYYHGGCYWRKQRNWDGHGYFYRRVRVCR
jgi:hypothetical protein